MAKSFIKLFFGKYVGAKTNNELAIQVKEVDDRTRFQTRPIDIHRIWWRAF